MELMNSLNFANSTILLLNYTEKSPVEIEAKKRDNGLIHYSFINTMGAVCCPPSEEPQAGRFTIN